MESIITICSALVVFGLFLILISHSVISASKHEKRRTGNFFKSIFIFFKQADFNRETRKKGIILFFIGVLFVILGMAVGIWNQG